MTTNYDTLNFEIPTGKENKSTARRHGRAKRQGGPALPPHAGNDFLVQEECPEDALEEDVAEVPHPRERRRPRRITFTPLPLHEKLL